MGSVSRGTLRSSARATGHGHHGRPGPLGRTRALLPAMSGRFFSLNPAVWGLTRAPAALTSLQDRSCRVPEHVLRRRQRELACLGGAERPCKASRTAHQGHRTRTRGGTRVQVEAFLELPLMEQFAAPAHPPNLAVVSMDGGRLQILDRREPAADPSDVAPGTGAATAAPAGAVGIHGPPRTRRPTATATGGRTRSVC